jgi:tryptophan synthase alpha chain
MSSVHGGARPAGGASRIMTHMVASYPDRAASLDVARALCDGGCAYIELQFPFSDPTADGPDIQRACASALAAGFKVTDGFRIAAEIRRLASVPIFIMSYANMVFTRGIEKFLGECRDAGAAGVIVPDLPPGYDEGLFSSAAAAGLVAMPVVSPSMSPERLQRVGALGTEYVYATLRIGTTGPRTVIDAAGLGFLSAIAAASSRKPVKILGGFGITSREQVTALEKHVHAVVVGSALVREVAGSTRPYAAVRDKVRELAGC